MLAIHILLVARRGVLLKMRILEAQNAVLTNLEVYKFLTSQVQEYQAQKRRGPSNLETLRGEVNDLLILPSLHVPQFKSHNLRIWCS